MIEAVICDDQPRDAAALRQLICRADPEIPIACYADADALLGDFISGARRFNLFFLDICLPGTGGLEAARRIREAQPDALIVFVSSSQDFYREAYDLFAFNYLVKPVTWEAFSKVFGRAQDQLDSTEKRNIRFSFGTRSYSLRHSDILYLTSTAHTVTFFLRDGKTLQAYGKLSDFARRLPEASFLRCHQSYLVNLNAITALERNGFLVGGTVIPISKSFSQAARARYREHLFSDFD